MTVKADDDEDLTELEKFAPTRLDGVDMPATGASFLMLKALGADPAPESTEKAATPVDAPQDQAPEAPAQDAPASPEPEASPAPEAGAPAEAAKSAAPDPEPGMVNVDIPAGASVSISPADLAKLATFKQQLVKDRAAKRDMDPNVGGGTDRDKIPAEDFAGPDRSFPIKIPGDVSDAASSLGRAKGGPGARAKIKAKIISIARRKGQAFVDELPEAWKDGGSAEKAKAKGKKKPFPGAAAPFGSKGKGKGKDDDADEGAKGGSGDDGGGKAEKAGTACKGCGGDMAGDAKFCPDCGEKAGDKAEKSRACKCGCAMAKGQKFCPDCGEKAKAPKAAKAGTACKGCGGDMAGDAKFCPNCGEKAKAPKAAKAAKPFPADANVDAAISRLQGDAEAALDAQAKDPDNGTHPADAKVEAELERVKADVEAAAAAQAEDERTDTAAGHEAKKSAAADGVPYHLARLHDATCAAYRHEDVIIAHPAVAKGIGDLVDPQAFAQMTADALADDGGTGSRAREIPALSEAFQHAVTLKSLAAAGSLDVAMDDVRKAFSEYYPDAHPAPGPASPGEFRRPYVSAGRANQAAKPGQEPRVPLSTHVPEASDFRRPLITAGREAASPGSNPAPSGAAKAGRAYYTNAARDSATAALTSMHDWIADNHPGVCAMTGSTYDGEPGRANSMGSSLTTAKPVPAQFALTRDTASPVTVSAAAASAAVTPSVTKAERKAAKAARKAAEMAQDQQAQADGAAPAVPAAPAIGPEMLKSMFREVVAEQLGDVVKANGELAQRVADLESAPDPAQMAPRSGAGMAKNAATANQEVPEGGDGFAVERIARLVKRAKDPDSGVSTAAIGELFEMVPREAAVQLLEAAAY